MCVVCALGLLCSCSKKEKIDATAPLKQSFEKSDPEVKKSIEVVNENLNKKNYAEALKTLTPVVSQPNLSVQQKEAIGADGGGGFLADGFFGGDEGGEDDDAGVVEELGDFAGAAEVFAALEGGEAEVLADSAAHILAVENNDGAAGIE